MRELYIFYVYILINISTSITGMQLTACAAQPKASVATVPRKFETALICVAQEAELKRQNEMEIEAKRKACVQVTRVPTNLIALGEPYAAGIKNIFDESFQGIEGLCGIVLEYIGDQYTEYKRLYFANLDSFGMLAPLYPCIGLKFDEDGSNLHAQLGGSRGESSKQLVRLSLFEDASNFDALQDYEQSTATSTKHNVPVEIRAEYMWWKASAKNAFKGEDYDARQILTVTLQYNVLHMIKACLKT